MICIINDLDSWWQSMCLWRKLLLPTLFRDDTYYSNDHVYFDLIWIEIIVTDYSHELVDEQNSRWITNNDNDDMFMIESN